MSELSLSPEQEEALRSLLENVPFHSIHELVKYHPEYIAPAVEIEQTLPWEVPSDYEFFAFVVEGEVANVWPIHKLLMAEAVAAWSSDPKVIVLADDQKNVVNKRWLYNYETGAFTQPL
jgi:hypothetical protein